MVDLYQYDCDPNNTDSLVETHYDFLVKLMTKRCQSLTANYLLPPLRYAAVLDSVPQKATAAKQRMLQEWQHLLKAEALQAAGQPVAPLGNMHFRLASVTRLAYMANERNQGELESIMRCLTTHVGDTALIENVHKEAKEFGLANDSFFIY